MDVGFLAKYQINVSPMKAQINQVLTGKVCAYGPNGEPSAYRKTETANSAAVEFLGLSGDQQADPKHHGGPEKAILHYAYDHYPVWRTEQPELAEHLLSPGAFGENISSTGLTEESVCLGDRFRLGTSIVEVSQGRQPCWKLGHRFGTPEMLREVIRTGRGGWYYRVIQTGYVRKGDTIELVDRLHPEWSVSTVSGLILGSDRDADALAALGELEALADNWRIRARRRLKNLQNK